MNRAQIIKKLEMYQDNIRLVEEKETELWDLVYQRECEIMKVSAPNLENAVHSTDKSDPTYMKTERVMCKYDFHINLIKNEIAALKDDVKQVKCMLATLTKKECYVIERYYIGLHKTEIEKKNKIKPTWEMISEEIGCVERQARRYRDIAIKKIMEDCP